MGAGRGGVRSLHHVTRADVTWPGPVVTSGATQVPAPAPASHSSIAAAGVSFINEGEQQ